MPTGLFDLVGIDGILAIAVYLFMLYRFRKLETEVKELRKDIRALWIRLIGK